MNDRKPTFSITQSYYSPGSSPGPVSGLLLWVRPVSLHSRSNQSTGISIAEIQVRRARNVWAVFITKEQWSKLTNGSIEYPCTTSWQNAVAESTSCNVLLLSSSLLLLQLTSLMLLAYCMLPLLVFCSFTELNSTCGNLLQFSPLGLHQLQNSFVADENLHGRNVLPLTYLLCEVLKVPWEKVCYCIMSLYHIKFFHI